jgi:hypothetical protein
MRRGGFQREDGVTDVPLMTRFTLLPLAERLFVALLVVLSVLVPVVTVCGEWVDPQAASVWGQLARQPRSLWLGAAGTAAVALLCLEPPRRASLRTWLLQLRERAHRARSTYDAGYRRLLQEQHHAADVEAP